MSAYGNILVPKRALGCTEAEAMEAWCSGLTCGPVKAETAGSNPVASAITNVVDNFRLHERKEIVDPLFYSPVPACPSTSQRYIVTRARIPEQCWVEVAQRHAGGESLRQLGFRPSASKPSSTIDATPFDRRGALASETIGVLSSGCQRCTYAH